MMSRSLLLAGLLLAAPAHAGDLRASALEAARLEFHRDGIGDASGQRTARLYDEACAAGHALSCGASQWRGGGLAAAAAPAGAACAQGDGVGCVIAGWAALDSGDEATALARFSAGCTAGTVRACVEEARLERDRGALEAACEAGQGVACLARAALAPETAAGHLDALAWLDRGCARTDPASCFARAQLAAAEALEVEPDHAGHEVHGPHSDHGTHSDHGHEPMPEQTLRQLYAQSCKQGHAAACRVWGHAHLSWGLGLDRSTISGIDPLVRACDLGLVLACGEAGGELVRGRAGNHRVEQGLRILDQGCTGGDGASCATLATAVHALTLAKTPLDLSAHDAPALAQRACELGHPGACGWLAISHHLGLSTGTPDPAGARALAEAHCPQDADACDVLGLLQSEAGASPTAAWEQACAGGSHLACVRLAAPENAVHSPTPSQRPLVPSDRPTKPLVPEGLAVLRALDAESHAAALCRRGLSPVCLQDATARLLPMDPRELDLSGGEQWLPLLERSCASLDTNASHDTKACLVAAQLHDRAGRGSDAVARWAAACQPRGLGHLACEALDRAAETTPLPPEAEAALCLAGRTAHCAGAARSRPDAPQAALLAATGCSAGDKAACKLVKKLTGAPFSGEVPAVMVAALDQAEPPPLPEVLVWGGLSASAADTLAAARPALRSCVARSRAAQGMWTTTVELRLEVDAAGQPGALVLRLPAAEAPDVGACMEAVVAALRFPQGGAGSLSARLRFVQEPPELPDVEPAEHHHAH